MLFGNDRVRSSIQHEAATLVTVKHRLAGVKVKAASLRDSDRVFPASGSRC